MNHGSAFKRTMVSVPNCQGFEKAVELLGNELDEKPGPTSGLGMLAAVILWPQGSAIPWSGLLRLVWEIGYRPYMVI